MNRLIDTTNKLLIGARLKKYCPSMPILRTKTSSFSQSGRESIELLERSAGLEPDDHILDVGCGPGRVALPLAEYLSDDASYYGIDVSQKCIDWCRDEITTEHRNFHFVHADIYNGRYNPKGTLGAKDYVFPFDNDRFDLIILFSVFTHMLEEDTRHYLQEIRRLLKSSGRCMFTAVVLTLERVARRDRLPIRYRHRVGDCMVRWAWQPERSVAYPLALLERLLSESGFRLRLPIEWGSWDGMSNQSAFFQDILVLEHDPADTEKNRRPS